MNQSQIHRYGSTFKHKTTDFGYVYIEVKIQISGYSIVTKQSQNDNWFDLFPLNIWDDDALPDHLWG